MFERTLPGISPAMALPIIVVPSALKDTGQKHTCCSLPQDAVPNRPARWDEYGSGRALVCPCVVLLSSSSQCSIQHSLEAQNREQALGRSPRATEEIWPLQWPDDGL